MRIQGGRRPERFSRGSGRSAGEFDQTGVELHLMRSICRTRIAVLDRQ